MAAGPHIQTGAATEVVLAVRKLRKEFISKKGPAVQALKGVSLEARRRQVTGLVGADGAGKTTLIRTAAGLLVPTAGSVTVLGFDSVVDTIDIQSRVGYMPQKFGLYQDLTVKENMDLYADLQGVPSSQRKDRYRRLLQMTGLEPYTRRMAGALSGGMKQKLGLACSLIKSPKMLLLDEPTVGVDPISRRELWKIVYELVERDGIGVLLSTAYLDEAERCDHVVVLHEGEKLAEGTPQEFKERVGQRVALVDPPADIKPRRIHTRLVGRAHIVDATIRSGRVRVVTDAFGTQAVNDALPKQWRATIKNTSATFEDAFMTLIPHRKSRIQIYNTEEPSDKTVLNEEVVVQTKALQKYFGDFEAVKRLTFEVHHGEIFGLLGPNGAGKSTTFRMLCGLLSASAGEISVAGYDLRHSPSRARSRLGYMAQQFSLYGQLSVKENLSFFGRAYGLGGNRLRLRLEWAFEEFGLGKWRDKAAGQLPGGYKQRLAMAASLLHEPDILFLDEPTSGVDPFARREFWLRIIGFAEQGVTVVVTTHFMEESEYCDRMLIMSQGENLAMGTPSEIRALARSKENPEPTIEDAFIALAEGTISPSGERNRIESSRGGK
ncbi:MAG: ATP-binding cassette domain-containing protein [Deltaproteobacteria bacterium]